MAHKPIESHEEYLKNLEHYRKIKKNAWQSMTLEEKIDFFDGIHTDHVPMFDENGNDTLWTLWNYGEIYKEFLTKSNDYLEKSPVYGQNQRIAS